MKPKISLMLHSLVSIIVILSFFTKIVNVYAEGELPQVTDQVSVTQPPADPPVISTELANSETVPSVDQSTPVPVNQTDTAATDAATQIIQSSTTSPTEVLQPSADSIIPSTSTESAAQDSNVSDTLLGLIDALPVETDLVVQDAEGNTLPLASTAAEEIIASGDPVWCPVGSKPGDIGCTTSFTHFNGADGLISALAADTSKTGEGTIYVSYDYAATLANGDKTDIIFDHLILNHLTGLIFQGGWDFATNSLNSTTTLDLGSGGLQFLNWGNSLALNNITVSNSSGGLVVDQSTGTSTADVTLNNVDQVGSGDYAALKPGTKINTSGSVTISTSTFNGLYEGLLVNSSGDISLDNVNGSTGYGDSARLDNSGGTGDISITDTTFIGTHNGNFVVLSKGDILFNNVTATGSGGTGIDSYLNNTYGTGSVFMTGTNEFGRGGGNGLEVYSNGNIVLNNVDSSRGGGIGAILDNSTGTGDIILTGTNDFSKGVRGCLTVKSKGNITLSNILADSAGGSGTFIDNRGGTGSVTLMGTNNFDSGHTGLRVLSNGDINLNNISVSAVGTDGAYLNNASGTGSVTLTGTNVFGRNTYNGLEIFSKGNISLNNITSNYNKGYGAYLDNSLGSGTILFTGTNTFIDNGLDNLVMHTNNITSIVTPTPVTSSSDEPITNAASNDNMSVKSYPPMLVPVTGGGGFSAFNCGSATILRLPTSDYVMATSDFCNMKGELIEQREENLPADLPVGGQVFVFGINLTVLDGLTPLTYITDPGHLTFSFRIPADLHDKEFAVYYWDETLQKGAGDWVEMPAYAEEVDGTPVITSLHAEESSESRMILEGVQKTKMNRVEFETNFPGLFVLAVKK